MSTGFQAHGLALAKMILAALAFVFNRDQELICLHHAWRETSRVTWIVPHKHVRMSLRTMVESGEVKTSQLRLRVKREWYATWLESLLSLILGANLLATWAGWISLVPFRQLEDSFVEMATSTWRIDSGLWFKTTTISIKFPS